MKLRERIVDLGDRVAERLDVLPGRWVLLLLAACALFGLLIGVAIAADTTTVTWQHPEQNNDDSPLALNDIAATEIEYGLCPLTAAKSVTINAPTEYAVSIPLPTPGLWCFRARTRDYMGAWGDWTDVVTRESPLPPYTGDRLPPFKLVM